MKTLIMVGAMLIAVGCESEDVQRQWNEAMRDARGDNMQMRNDFSTSMKPAARKPPAQNDDNN
jgi:hypothetical protein